MIFKGHGIVWDAIKNKPLCQFENGIFETEDTEIINKLVDLGYAFEGEIPSDDGFYKEDNKNPDEIKKGRGSKKG